MLMMRTLSICISIVLLLSFVSSDEVNIHVSSKNPKDLSQFLIRLFKNNLQDPQRKLNMDVRINYGEKENVIKKNLGRIKGSNDVECLLCKEIMGQLSQLINKDSTKDEIKNALHQVCNNLPWGLKDQCSSFVDRFVDQIVAFITSGHTIGEICHLLTLCSVKGEIKSQLLTKSFDPSKIELKNVECSLCKMVMKELLRHVNSKSTKMEIEKALHKVCNQMSRMWRHKCYKMVDKFANKIVDFIIAGYASEKICELLMLCVEQDFLLQNPQIIIFNENAL